MGEEAVTEALAVCCFTVVVREDGVPVLCNRVDFTVRLSPILPSLSLLPLPLSQGSTRGTEDETNTQLQWRSTIGCAVGFAADRQSVRTLGL
jgi:hypothetical protein